MKPLKANSVLRLFLNLLFTVFILIASLSNNDKNLPIGFILLYNILLFSPAWVNNFWLLPQLRRTRNVGNYVVALIIFVLVAVIILGSYLQWLYFEFNTSELINFTPLAATSSAPAGLEKYQCYFDVLPGIIILTTMMIVGYSIQQFLFKIKNEKQIQAQHTIAELKEATKKILEALALKMSANAGS